MRKLKNKKRRLIPILLACAGLLGSNAFALAAEVKPDSEPPMGNQVR